MSKILIIDKDVATAQLIKRLCQVLALPVDIVQTHSSATRSYLREQVAAVFLSSEMPLLDHKALLDEFDASAIQRKKPRAPVIILYKNKDDLHRLRLNEIPNSRSMSKPILMEEVYELFDGLGLTKAHLAIEESSGAGRKLNQHGKFIEESEAWLAKLKMQLSKS